MAAVTSRHIHFLSPPVSHVKYLPPASRCQDKDDLVAKIQRITDPKSDFIYDETDDDLPPIERVLNPKTRHTIPIFDYNIGYGSQNPGRPIVNTNEYRMGSKQSKLDNDEKHNTGTRDSPMILEDDDKNTSNHRVTDISADEPGQQIRPSTQDVWYDVEDSRYVDGDGRPIPQLQPDSSTSTSMLAQNNHCSRYRSSLLSQEQTNPDDNDNIPDIYDDQTLGSSCTHIAKKNEEECTKELERDMLLAFEELEKSSSATPEPSQLQPDQERHQSSSTEKTIDEYGQRSTFNNCHPEAEQSRSQSQEQQQQHQQQEDTFDTAGTETQIREDLVSAGEVIFHGDSADHHREAADHDPHHARELQPQSESTEDQPVPASEIQAQCFRIRGIRTLQSADCQSVATQYRIVWGKRPNKRSSWVKEGDIQLYMLIQHDARDCVDLCMPSKRNITKIRKMRASPYHASKKLYEYLVDDSPHWVSECQLIISFCSTNFSNLIVSSPNLSSQASPEINVMQSITPINDSNCDSLQNSHILSGFPTSSSPVLDRKPQPRKLVEKRRRLGSDETSSNSYRIINTEYSHYLCDVSSDEEHQPPKRRKKVAASQSRRSPQHEQGPATTAVQHRHRRTATRLVDNSPTPLFEPTSRASSLSAESEATSSEESHVGTVATDPDREWEISHFVKMEVVGGKRYFLTNWKQTWEPESALDGARELVDEFLAGLLPSRPKSSKRRHMEKEGRLERRWREIRSNRSDKAEPKKRRGRPRKPINPLHVDG